MKNDAVLNSILGIFLVILGFFTLGAQIYTTFLSVALLGWILVIAGAAQSIYGIVQYFKAEWSLGTMSLLGGVLNLILGALVVSNPGISAATFTLFIAISFFVYGIYNIVMSFAQRDAQWGLRLFGGIITFILGSMIMMGFPGTSLYIIGLFIGIEFILYGVTMIFPVFDEQPALTSDEKKATAM